MKKKIIYSIIILSILFIGFFISKKKKNSNINECKKIESYVTDVKKSIEVDAELKSSNYADISTEIPTLIKWVGVDINDEVVKGQKLVKLDRSTISAQIKNLKLAVERAELVEQEGRLKSRHLTEKQKLSLKKASEQARQNLNQVYAQANKTVIKSPIDGVVINKRVNSGEVASGILMRIIDINSLKLEALIPEVDIPKVYDGKKVKILFDAYLENPQVGFIENIEMSAINLQGNTYFKANIKIPDLDKLTLLEGMNAEITIEYDKKENVLAIPREYIKKDDKGYYLFEEMNKNSKISYEKKYLKVGIIGDDNIEILNHSKDNLNKGKFFNEMCNIK